MVNLIPKQLGEYLAQYMPGHGAKPIKLGLELDNDVISYLSGAQLAGLNIITCTERGVRTGIFDVLCSSLPKFGIVAIITQAPDEVDTKTMVRAVILDISSTGRRKVLGKALELKPMKIISEVQLDRTSELFSYASRGGSFACAITGSYDRLSIVDALLSSRFNVKIEDLNMLDIFISFKTNGTSALVNIYEYRWMSRAETMNGTTVRNSDSFEVTEIVHENKMTGAVQKMNFS